MFKKEFKGWNLFEVLWLSVFSLIAIGLTVYWKDTLLGLIVFLTGVFCVVLSAKGSLQSYYFGLFNTLGYAYISYNNQLYGEVGLNLLFFLPMNIVGFVFWKKHMRTAYQVEMKKMSLKYLGITSVVSVGLIGLLGYALSLIPTQNTPYIDATTNVLSVVATILAVKRLKEQWLMYIVLNCFTILMWTIRTLNGSPDGLVMIVMWSAYLVNAFYGYYLWSKGAASGKTQMDTIA